MYRPSHFEQGGASSFTPPLRPHRRIIFFRFRQNCYLTKLSISFVMGIADMPCSGYVRDEGELHYCMDVSLSCCLKHSPGRQHAAAKKGDQAQLLNKNVVSPGTTSATQPSTKKANSQRRPTPKTSTVARPRSGWCGFSDFAGGLPGPIGRVLGR